MLGGHGKKVAFDVMKNNGIVKNKVSGAKIVKNKVSGAKIVKNKVSVVNLFKPKKDVNKANDDIFEKVNANIQNDVFSSFREDVPQNNNINNNENFEGNDLFASFGPNINNDEKSEDNVPVEDPDDEMDARAEAMLDMMNAAGNFAMNGINKAWNGVKTFVNFLNPWKK